MNRPEKEDVERLILMWYCRHEWHVRELVERVIDLVIDHNEGPESDCGHPV